MPKFDEAKPIAPKQSKHLWTKTLSIFTNDLPICINGDRHDVFLYFNCIFIITLAVEKLLKAGHQVVHDFLLRLHAVSVMIRRSQLCLSLVLNRFDD